MPLLLHAVLRSDIVLHVAHHRRTCQGSLTPKLFPTPGKLAAGLCSQACAWCNVVARASVWRKRAVPQECDSGGVQSADSQQAVPTEGRAVATEWVEARWENLLKHRNGSEIIPVAFSNTKVLQPFCLWPVFALCKAKKALCSKFCCHPRGSSHGFTDCVKLLSDVKWCGLSEGSRTSCCALASETLESLQRSGMYYITVLLIAAVFTRTLWTLHVLHSRGSF